jgi:hypothetical protein
MNGPFDDLEGLHRAAASNWNPWNHSIAAVHSFLEINSIMKKILDPGCGNSKKP